ncbi:MAG: DNA-binding protein, partial [Gemmatimonadetes bacterium]|nr:DNA-binding protein [Gemmatimonadota bacterium]
MNTRTLFLAWEDQEQTRQWFPIGRLDADIERPLYRFRYIEGAKRAQKELKFPPLWDFPQLLEDYKSLELFPLFRNRVIAQGRPDRTDYLGNLGLHENADPFDMLSVSGGYRVTDDYEVFPKLVKAKDGSFVCRFFLHGWRHTSRPAQERLNALKTGEELYVTLELTNPVTGLAVQLQTTDYHMIGWTPRYIV